MSDKPDTKPLFWINPDDVTLPAESNMIYVTASNFDGNTIPVYRHQPQGVWQPIETAPKEGRILVWNAFFGVYSSEFTIERVYDCNKALSDCAIKWQGYPLGLTNIGLGKWYCEPTLWQPLPAAPSVEQIPAVSCGSRKEIENLRARNDKLYAEAANERILRYAAEAERDALILEYCPNEMTVERQNNWANHQKPFGYWHQGQTQEGIVDESDFFLYSESGDVSCKSCVKLYTHPETNANAVNKAVQAETERCAKMAREFQLSPVVGKAIAALIVNEKQTQST